MSYHTTWLRVRLCVRGTYIFNKMCLLVCWCSTTWHYNIQYPMRGSHPPISAWMECLYSVSSSHSSWNDFWLVEEGRSQSIPLPCTWYCFIRNLHTSPRRLRGTPIYNETNLSLYKSKRAWDWATWVRGCNYVKFKTERKLPPVLKIVTCSEHAA